MEEGKYQNRIHKKKRVPEKRGEIGDNQGKKREEKGCESVAVTI